MSEPTVPIHFAWKSVMPDHRQFKQNSVILEPAVRLIVTIRVPITSVYVDNAAKLLAASVDATTIEPFLTPLGMRYVMDQLESVLPDVPLKSADFDPDTEDDEGWEKGEDDITDEEFGWEHSA